MRKYLILVIAVFGLLAFPAAASAKDIAFTFDDAPLGDQVLSGVERDHKLLAALQDAGISKAGFFVIGQNLRTKTQWQRLKDYVAAGHIIANHSYAHQPPEAIGATAYIQGIRQTHALLKDLTGFRPWYRFPMLHEGKTAADRDAIRAGLDALKLQNGYVTVDNYDWYLVRKYVELQKSGKSVDLAKLKTLYIDHIIACIEFYDQLAVRTLGRSPKHVLLLHDNDLAALFVTDLAQALRERDWNIIPIDEAFQDDIATARPNILPAGNSLISAMAKEKGLPGEMHHVSEEESYWDKVFAETFRTAK